MSGLLAGTTMIMSGGSRGIGLAIAVRAARDGANVALIAKTEQPDPRLPGTIHTAADETESRHEEGIAANCVWPRTLIATAAVRNLLGGDAAVAVSRKPEIMGDAAHEILTRPARECTGNTFIDDEVLAEAGVTDLSGYRFAAGNEDPLQPDLFL